MAEIISNRNHCAQGYFASYGYPRTAPDSNRCPGLPVPFIASTLFRHRSWKADFFRLSKSRCGLPAPRLLIGSSCCCSRMPQRLSLCCVRLSRRGATPLMPHGGSGPPALIMGWYNLRHMVSRRRGGRTAGRLEGKEREEGAGACTILPRLNHLIYSACRSSFLRRFQIFL